MAKRRYVLNDTQSMNMSGGERRFSMLRDANFNQVMTVICFMVQACFMLGKQAAQGKCDYFVSFPDGVAERESLFFFGGRRGLTRKMQVPKKAIRA